MTVLIGVGGSSVMSLRILSSAVLALALATSAHAAAFDVYRAACLDTNAELVKVRELAASKKWEKLTDADKDRLAPGSFAMEGWVAKGDGARYLVSISGSTASSMAGERAGAAVTSCSVLAPSGDHTTAMKTYSDFLKRPPSSTEAVEGLTTYVWVMQNDTSLTYHYLAGGSSMPGLSLSINVIGK
jgi:hypothetical protein